MKSIFLKVFLFFSLACFSQENSKINFLHTRDQKIVDANNENVLLRGIGLGGYMLQEGYMLKFPFQHQQQHVIKEEIQKLIGEEKTEEFYNKWRNNFIQKADVDSLKKWGFNSIRLPMHYNLYTLPVEEEPVVGKNTWLETGFKMTDSLVKWCKANEIYLILDMHATPGGQGHDLNISDRDPSKPSLWESEANQQKLIALWKKLAERYKDESTIGAYDIINEPNWSFEGRTEGVEKNGVADTGNQPLKDLMVKITSAIRDVDQNHIIIIEGNGWGNNYNGILPPWDDNMVLSFHKYWNFNTQKEIQKYLDYREKYNIPIWLGESGENSNVWFADAIQLMEENNIGWCWWPLKKLGYNNPLQIKTNYGYHEILEYWRGNLEKPSEEDAYKAFMKLAENTKIENCIIHYGVIDAMMRQPHTDKIRSFGKIVISDKTEIPAVHYDMGKNGIAYYDTDFGNYYVSTGGERTRWNNGNIYRNDGVDIFEDETGFYVGDTKENEWLQYTFQVENEGNYRISFQLASSAEGKAEIVVNDRNLGAIHISDTSDEWKWFSLENVKLQKGKNQLKFKIENGGFQFRSIRFEKQ
ncbi:glycosyl hydrolase family 5 [Christiangramia fulva]|uniref:Glycosyl hydrolase family 5 n=1 Tax=Christiangramia fulva TaxID=2126553 RepID=A0A2R3Z2Z0_9FLAO|nr:cellulase family glycosylhydrolase [Christiangramia fulva]AVR44631.1 glycosyl hydrolase family 5 [Christiangramia fulva]